jgi:hypothetical protein
LTEWEVHYVENRRKRLHFGDEEAALGVPRKATDLKVEPTFRVYWLAREKPILTALESKLHEETNTWKSDTCFTTRMLPESKLEVMVM